MRRFYSSTVYRISSAPSFSIVTVLAVTAISISLGGQPPTHDSAPTLTWEDCLRVTMSNHPSIRAASERVRAAQSAIDAARSDLLPQLSLAAGVEHAEQDGRSTSDDASLNAALSAEQVLFSGGRKSAAIESARAALVSAMAEYRSTRADLTYRLRTAFVDLLIAQSRVGVLQQIEQRRRENLELVRLRYEGGREHKGSLAMIEAALFQAQTELRQAVREVHTARQILWRTMAWTNAPIDFAVTANLVAAPPPDDVDTAKLVEKTPDLERALAAVGSAQAALRSARSGNRPDLRLVGSAGRSGNTESFESDQWSIGVRLSFPFWSGGRTQHETAQAQARLRMAEEEVAEQRLRLAANLHDVLRSYQNAVEDERVQARYFEAADLRADIARQQYGSGLLSFENWDVIENDRISYQRRLLDAQRLALLAEAAWLYAIGYDAFSALIQEIP